MKKWLLSCCFSLLLTGLGFGQGVFPVFNVKGVEEAKTFSSADFSNDGLPIVVVFWTTANKPGIKHLGLIAEEYEHWQAETGVKLIGIATNSTGTVDQVRSYVQGKNWQYELYLDENGTNGMSATHITSIPYVFVLNANREIVYQGDFSTDGVIDVVYRKVKELVGK